MTGMILIDLRKAFDTIDRDTLLKKLGAICFLNYNIDWFKSYLSNQFFRLNLENYYLDLSNIICRVSQGPVLGPFILTLANDSCLVFSWKGCYRN